MTPVLPPARDPEAFDAFYQASRERLLVQTWALTGDLAAARSAVRSTYVVAWHQWRKVARLEDPEEWARPYAWAQALRRHTARLGQRDKGLDPEVKATLDALGALTLDQRKALLLTHLAAVSMDQMARELGLPRTESERELQVATAQFSLVRDVPSPVIGSVLDRLAAAVTDVAWPPAADLRKAGATRRRRHTALGAVAAVAALVVSGVAVTDSGGVRPTLDRVPSGRPAASSSQGDPEPPLTADAMLGTGQVGRSVRGRDWEVARTDGNTEGDGRLVPCQAERYADPRGRAALVRTFDSRRPRNGPRSTVAQLTEVSRTEKAALRTFRRTRDWYAGCDEDRIQLLSTRRVGAVGDQAMLLALRSWESPVRTLVVGIARTGEITTTTAVRTLGQDRPDIGGGTRLLADAVADLCPLPDGGSCSGTPEPDLIRPLPVGEVPSMLSEIDLPPVRGVQKPWTGTPAERARQNPAATPCDRTVFRGGGMTNNLTRTFFVLKARLPPQFGLTETVGSLPRARAIAFVDGVRRRIDRCAADDLTTDVTRLTQTDTRREDLTVWVVSTEVSENTTVRYLMAIARTGTAVAQVGFVPAGARTISDADFVALARRALERLHEQPPP